MKVYGRGKEKHSIKTWHTAPWIHRLQILYMMSECFVDISLSIISMY